jgi:hypothetical protein
MAKRLFTTIGQSWTATATNTLMAANDTYMGMQGGNTTMVCDILEILISGTASASTIGGFVFGPVKTVPAGALTITGTGATDGVVHAAATALATTYSPYNNVATTQPTTYTAATVSQLNLGLNLFGGIIRWNAAPTQQMSTVGNTAAAPIGSYLLFNCTSAGGQTGTANAHIMYEPY